MQTYLLFVSVIGGRELLFFKQSLKHTDYILKIFLLRVNACAGLDLFQN